MPKCLVPLEPMLFPIRPITCKLTVSVSVLYKLYPSNFLLKVFYNRIIRWEGEVTRFISKLFEAVSIKRTKAGQELLLVDTYCKSATLKPVIYKGICFGSLIDNFV